MISDVKIIFYIGTIIHIITVSSQFQCNLNIFAAYNMIIYEKYCDCFIFILMVVRRYICTFKH